MSRVPGTFDGQQPMPVPAVPQALPLFGEYVVHHASLTLIDAADGKSIMRFLMPNGQAVSVILDEPGKEALVQMLKGTNISIARGR